MEQLERGRTCGLRVVDTRLYFTGVTGARREESRQKIERRVSSKIIWPARNGRRWSSQTDRGRGLSFLFPWYPDRFNSANQLPRANWISPGCRCFHASRETNAYLLRALRESRSQRWNVRRNFTEPCARWRRCDPGRRDSSETWASAWRKLPASNGSRKCSAGWPTTRIGFERSSRTARRRPRWWKRWAEWSRCTGTRTRARPEPRDSRVSRPPPLANGSELCCSSAKLFFGHQPQGGLFPLSL